MASIEEVDAYGESTTESGGNIDARRFSSSSGAALELEHVAISIGNNDIISNINWTMYPNERWALVGPNGAGKSTLLRALTGTGGKMVNIREGGVTIGKNKRIGYLEQRGFRAPLLRCAKKSQAGWKDFL